MIAEVCVKRTVVFNKMNPLTPGWVGVRGSKRGSGGRPGLDEPRRVHRNAIGNPRLSRGHRSAPCGPPDPLRDPLTPLAARGVDVGLRSGLLDPSVDPLTPLVAHRMTLTPTDPLTPTRGPRVHLLKTAVTNKKGVQSVRTYRLVGLPICMSYGLWRVVGPKCKPPLWFDRLCVCA